MHTIVYLSSLQTSVVWATSSIKMTVMFFTDFGYDFVSEMFV